MSLTIGSRTFAPRLLMTLLTLVVFSGLISLGRWQLHRAAEKRVLYQQFSDGTSATQSIAKDTPAVTRYQHVEVRGRYDQTRQVLVDSMVDEAGRVGYYVITPLILDGGGLLLVNRGFVPQGRSRKVLPPIAVDAEERRITGRIDHMPVAGIQLGERLPLKPPFPVVASFPSRAEIGALLNESDFSSAGDLLLLDRDQPDGYERNWVPPGFPPERHIGYAVQWFGLAAALLVIYIVTNTKKTVQA
ncbi:MAG TPA: SURF1 family protein [Steroidobacteraceae bacterium]